MWAHSKWYILNKASGRYFYFTNFTMTEMSGAQMEDGLNEREKQQFVFRNLVCDWFSQNEHKPADAESKVL